MKELCIFLRQAASSDMENCLNILQKFTFNSKYHKGTISYSILQA